MLKSSCGMLEYLIEMKLDQRYASNDARQRAAIRANIEQLIREETNDPAARLLLQQHADRIASALNFGQDKPLLDANAMQLRRSLSPRVEDQSADGPPLLRRADMARSRLQPNGISFKIFGAIFDFPELLNSAEAFEAAALVERDMGLGLAAVRQASNGIAIDSEQLLAQLPASIHPFALARLAAPQHEKLEDARTELLGNVAKLRKLEQKQETSAVLPMLEQADRQGNIEAQNDLLREKFENARRNLQRGRA